MIEKLLDTISTSIYNKSERYFYDGHAVPRVTEILSSMLHEDYLMTWANNIGLYQRIKYSESMEKSSNIGTYSHELVEQYINKQMYDINHYNIRDFSIIKAVTNCVESFKLWYTQVFSNNDVQVIGMEEKLSCAWFGGTYDALLSINGKRYLVDFKTSNHISYKYFLQIAAYKYMLSLNGIEIDGALILQLNKKKPEFNEYIVDFSNDTHKEFIDNCTECFFSLVYAYFNRLQIEEQYKNIFGGK